MGDNMAIKAVQLTAKFFYLIFKAIWYVLSFGFRMYKQHRDKKEEALRQQTRLAQNNLQNSSSN